MELEKYSQQPGVYNICNGQVAPDTVDVQNALAIGSEQSRQFSASLSSEFHKTIKKVKTMELLKNAVTVKGKAIYDVVTLFSRLLVVGQQRSIDIADVFQFELNPVPLPLIDEYGCLRKGDKAVLVKSLSVSVTTPYAPDVVLVDAVSFCITSSDQFPRLQRTWLQASALDWPTTLLSPRKSFCSTDMTKKLPAQRTMSGREEEEPTKYV